MAGFRSVFAGFSVRQLRKAKGLDQTAFAEIIGISVSYLSQIENDERPVSTRVAHSLTSHFGEEWRGSVPADDFASSLILAQELADTGQGEAEIDPDRLRRFSIQFPDIADRMRGIQASRRQSVEQLHLIEEALASNMAEHARMPWEAVRDWFHSEGNYFHDLDRLAEGAYHQLGSAPLDEKAIIYALKRQFGVDVELSDHQDIVRHFDKTHNRLAVSSSLPATTRKFQIANQYMRLLAGDELAKIINSASLTGEDTRHLLSLGLINYAAGAFLMPYRAFREEALKARHDIDVLARQFGVSFEQACHRLSNLQRPGLQGIPFFFCRVDMAGNITKRHSATRLQFARFGGTCPLWVVHEAVAIPDRILTQMSETPDGVRYISMAKGLVKPSGSFTRPPRRYAVALGCEIEHASDFIYADGFDLRSKVAATPMGVTCRLCPRLDCDLRAFPPAGKDIKVDPDERRVVPYTIGN